MRYCFIFLLLVNAYTCLSAGSTYTFRKNIQPIIIDKCASCHNKAGSAPFNLLSYEDVAGRKKQVKYVIEQGIMPIWKPDPSFSHFENENYLTADEIGKILTWIDQGAEEGKGKVVTKSNIKKPIPDIVLEGREPLIIKPTGEETFAVLKIPFEFEEGFDVRGIELVTGQSRFVHHASIFVLEDIADTLDMAKGNQQFVFPPLYADTLAGADFHLYNYLNLVGKNKNDYWDVLRYKTHWQPGMSFKPFPDGMGFKMPKKGVILIDMIHYLQAPKQLMDNMKVNIYKSKANASRFCISSSIGIGDPNSESSPIVLMPNQTTWQRAVTTLPADMSLFEVTPHMHNIGRRFIAYAVTPANDTIRLIRINDWDMSWQETYRFNPLIHLSKGTKIIVEGYYDNTTANIKNPFNPPQVIKQSMSKQDEMLLLIISFFEYAEGDEKKVLRYSN